MKKLYNFPVFKGLLAFAVCVFFTNLAFATTYTTIANGNWATGSVWDPTGPPPNSGGPHTVIINHAITVTAVYTYNVADLNITINNGASLTIDGSSNQSLDLTANSKILLINDGSIVGIGGGSMNGDNIRLRIGAFNYTVNALAAITAQNNNVTLTNTGALPAELTKFDAKPRLGSTEINWTTDSECNVSHFEIERSADSKVFEKIGETRSSIGCSAIERNYFFTDKNPVSGLNFYRLRTVDTDGAAAFSGIKTVQSSVKKQEVLVVPNKTEGAFSIENTGREDARFSIRNINGQLVESGEIAAGSSLELHATNWQSGIYTILFEKGGLFELTRLVKI